MEKKFILRFKGNKAELHEQLKEWCKANERTINGTIIDLIRDHIKKVNK